MGSHVVNALIEQRAKHKTNPDNLNPEVSKPILQDPFRIVTPHPTLIEQQRVQSAPNVGTTSPSRPIQQLIVSTAGGPTPTSNPIEQRNLVRGILDADVGKVIEQRAFLTRDASEKPIEQRDARRAIINGGPIEQTERVINDIDIEQFDFIDLIFPPCESIRNPVDTNILIRLADFGFPFDLNSLVFNVDGADVQDSPEFQATPLVNGVQLDYNPPENFAYSAEIVVAIEILDTAPTPNRFVFRCSWFTVADTIDPVVQNFTLCGQTAVEPNAPVEFDVLDLQTGINPDSIQLNVEGITVCSGIELTEIATASGSGFHVRWEHPSAPFRFGSNVTVAVEASDNAIEPNSVLFLCRFLVRQSTPPEFINFDPAPCETFVDNTTGLTFEVYGAGEGVDIRTLEVRVDNKTRRVFVRPRIRRVL